MRVLCVGRHEYLSDHFCRFFRALGIEAWPAVGLQHAAELVGDVHPDAVICDYDLLATIPLDSWERDPRLSTVPVIAVSMTRRPTEVHAVDVNGIAGFLYLPTLDADDARRVIDAARPRRIAVPADALAWPRPVAQLG